MPCAVKLAEPSVPLALAAPPALPVPVVTFVIVTPKLLPAL
jgi:hypothetical protein